MPDPNHEAEIELGRVDVERKYDEEIAHSAVEALLHSDRAIPEAVVFLGLEQAQMEANYFSPDIDAAQRHPVEDPVGGVRNNDGHDDAVQRQQAVRDVLQRNNAGDPGEAERRKQENVRRFLLFFGLTSITLSVATLILAAVHRCACGRSADDLPLSAEIMARIKELVAAWKNLREVDFWAQMANYATINAATLADLIYFMQYTKQLSPLTEPFLWNSYADQTAFVDQLLAADRAHGIGALFNWLPTLRYQQSGKSNPTGLPRFYCADLAQMALAELAK